MERVRFPKFGRLTWLIIGALALVAVFAVSNKLSGPGTTPVAVLNHTPPPDVRSEGLDVPKSASGPADSTKLAADGSFTWHGINYSSCREAITDMIDVPESEKGPCANAFTPPPSTTVADKAPSETTLTDEEQAELSRISKVALDDE